MNKRLMVVPFLVIIPLGFMVALAYYMDKHNTIKPGGETTYINYCRGCHGKTGNGMGITAKANHLKPQDFRIPEFWNDRTEEGILEVIKNGKNKMPAFEKFIKEPDRKEVLAYIKKRFGPKEETTPDHLQFLEK